MHRLTPLVLLFALVAGAAHAATPSVSAGSAHVLAVNANGTLRSWGSDDHGTLGVGRALTSGTPRATVEVTGKRIVAVSGYVGHVLALTAEGEVYAWGANDEGQLGDGTQTPRAIPARTLGLPRVVAVSAGEHHSAAIDVDGRVWTWGGNQSGELGEAPSLLPFITPAPVLGMPRIRTVVAGASRTFAVGEDGSLWAWGNNDFGNLGDGTTNLRSTPVRITGIDDVVSVSDGAVYTLAARRDGSVWSWGNNDNGVLGTGTRQSRIVPGLVPGVTGAATVAAGPLHGAVLRTDGTVWTWGQNINGQLGNGTTVERLTPAAVPSLSGITAISSTSVHTLARKSDGTLWAWGGNGGCEVGTCAGSVIASPRRVTEIPDAAAISAGTFFSLSITSSGRVWAWGLNSTGQLGNNDSMFRATPTVIPDVAGIRSVSAGALHSLALKDDGTVLAWGNSVYGQIGAASFIPVSRPQVGAGMAALTSMVAISAGTVHNLALRSDGTVWAWGANNLGQLGAPITALSRATALPIQGIADATAIDAGGAHNLALRANGTVLAWGDNEFNQLGDGTRLIRTTPITVPGLTNIASISAGAFSSAAVGRDGSVWTWGNNDWGQLGDGTLQTRATPVRLSGLPAMVSIDVGTTFMAALAADGTVWTWGRNSIGQLGDGSAEHRFTPARVPGVDNVVAISATNEFVAALRRDGTVFTWGSNHFAQLGDGTLVNRHLAVVTLRELGAGSLASNDWYLSLSNSFSAAIPPDKLPAFSVVASAVSSGIDATLRARPQDNGISTNVYVFALAPAAIVKGAEKQTSDLPLALKAKDAQGKDTPVACVLAQLNSAGEMVAVSSANLQAYLTGVLNAQGQSVSILAGTPVSSVGGATFFVGYGSSGSAMINGGTNRGVVTVPGQATCQPQPPQKGWWWNPAEDGRGFSVEVRGSNLFFASFLYDVSGRSNWYVSTGPVSLDGSLYSGDLLGARGGQTLGGAYPGFPTLKTEGTIALAFNSATEGTMVWPGGTVPIQRFNIIQNGVALGPAASVPESGWWWNENEPGRGFFMEWQGNTLDIAGYMYDDAGNPVWYLTVGDMAANGQSFSGNWWSYGNGQTLTGAWKPNTRLSTNVAPMTVTFSGPDTALMTLPNGRSTALKRHRF